jgi:hypothetical protein
MKVTNKVCMKIGREKGYKRYCQLPLASRLFLGIEACSGCPAYSSSVLLLPVVVMLPGLTVSP